METITKKVAFFVSLLAFVADLYAVYELVSSFLSKEEELLSGELIVQFIFSISVFFFGLFLLLYSQVNQYNRNIFDQAIIAFSAIYFIASAILLAGISLRFFLLREYTFSEFIVLPAMSVVIASLGYCLALTAENIDMEKFSIPFMIVAVVQIILFMTYIFSGDLKGIGARDFGNLILFACNAKLMLFILQRKAKKN